MNPTIDKPIKVAKQRGKFSLELNSHSLSYFQNCEQLYKFTDIDLLAVKEDYYPFKRGAGIARYLAFYYLALKRNYKGEKLKKLEDKLFKRMIKCNSFKNPARGEDDTLHIASRLMGYFNKYRDEDYKVIAVEKGFSKVLYEDSNVLFTYSGKPDLVVDFGPPYGVGPIDHKSESRANDLTPFQNQFVGYAWALNAKVGMINYIGLQKDNRNNEVFRRTAFNFSHEQIEKWRNDTIQWYYRIMTSIVNKRFLRSWNCDGKWGTCRYHNICIAASPKEEQRIKERDFKILDNPYKSW